MLEEAKSVLDAFKDRLSSPWFGVFLISWCLINWKLALFLVFSSVAIELKIEKIVQEYYSTEYCFLYPAASSAIYLLISPIIGYLAFLPSNYFHILKQKKQRKDHLTLLQMDTLLTYKAREKEVIEKEKFENIREYVNKKKLITNAKDLG